MPSPYFSPATFHFLSALAANNQRDWFLAHKPDYERNARDPALRLIEDLREPMRAISEQFVPDPRTTGGSLFRIYRDARFSNNKSPYKTHLGVRIRHSSARLRPAPSFYLHIDPAGSFIGGGLWSPEPKVLKTLRDFLVENPASWIAATQSPAFKSVFALHSDQLTRAPRGYPSDHPLLEDLKRRHLVALSGLTEDQLKSGDLLALVIERFSAMAGLMDYLCAALELEF